MARDAVSRFSAAETRRKLPLLFVKDLLFLILVPGMMVAGFPYLVLQTRGAPPAWPELGSLGWRAAGLLLMAGGAVGFLACVIDFARSGRGTPFPLDPPKELVVSGLYRYVRNPMYIAILAVVLGEIIVYLSGEMAAYWLSVLAGFHLFVVLYEEPTLRRRFGVAYEEYARSVPRWLPRQTAGPRTRGRSSLPRPG
jgi:protein-S-isoprenylcysteine O-methyltransferase Ste14